MGAQGEGWATTAARWDDGARPLGRLLRLTSGRWRTVAETLQPLLKVIRSDPAESGPLVPVGCRSVATSQVVLCSPPAPTTISSGSGSSVGDRGPVVDGERCSSGMVGPGAVAWSPVRCGCEPFGVLARATSGPWGRRCRRLSEPSSAGPNRPRGQPSGDGGAAGGRCQAIQEPSRTSRGLFQTSWSTSWGDRQPTSGPSAGARRGCPSRLLGEAPDGIPSILHWDGRAWTETLIAEDGRDRLFCIAAGADRALWVGGSNGLLLRWNGRDWSRMASGVIGTYCSIVPQPDALWIVGDDPAPARIDLQSLHSPQRMNALPSSDPTGSFELVNRTMPVTVVAPRRRMAV